jgi:hypothetical protein
MNLNTSTLWLPWTWLFGLDTDDEAGSREPLPDASGLPPSIFVRDEARARFEAMSERLAGLLAGRVLSAPDEDVLHEVDAVLRSGHLPRYMRAMLAATNLPVLSEHASEFSEHAKALAERLPATARDRLNEGIEILAHLLVFLTEFHNEVEPGEMDAAVVQAAREPMDYLARLPPPVARLMLSSERGLVAYMALEPVLGEHWFPVDDDRIVLLATLFRDGMTALARLIAAARPEMIPESLITTADRLDREALLAAQAAEDARFAALIAAADADGAAVYVPPDDA